jgi:hypothetical protein
LVDGLFKYKQSGVYVPQGKLRLLAFKENIIVSLPAIEERKIHHRMVSRRYHWPCMKEIVIHFVKAWVDVE